MSNNHVPHAGLLLFPLQLSIIFAGLFRRGIPNILPPPQRSLCLTFIGKEQQYALIIRQ
jgi:hypothetical protein